MKRNSAHLYISVALAFCPFISSAQAPICTLAANRTSVIAGDIFILTATCAPVPTAFIWTGPGAPARTSVPSILITAPSEAGPLIYSLVATRETSSSVPVEFRMPIGVSTPPPPPIPPRPVPPPITPSPSVGLAVSCPVDYKAPANLQTVSTLINDSRTSFVLAPGQVVAARFTAPSNYKVARVEMLSDNYIDGKDFSISSCPGEFSETLPSACVSRVMGSTMLMFASDTPAPAAELSRERCHLRSGNTYFFNTRMSNQGGSSVTIHAERF
jgi:hypothetical protein